MTGPAMLVDVLAAIALAIGFAAQMVRWLRVLQREHYEPSSMSRFLGRWTSPSVASATSPTSMRLKRPITLSHVLLVVLVVAVVVRADAIVVVVAVIYGLFAPRGLALKGRTSALQWTRRLRTVAVCSTIAAFAIAVAGAFSTRPWLLAVAMVWAVPALLDVTTRLLAPYENRRAAAFVARATTRLERVQPRVVAITGSFGKTSTKNHLFDLLAPDGGVVASPRSFNNRAGLSRSINENLADGTRIFIAEMGTYGPGEIRDLCSWCPPDLAVITAIGPVHLERMRTLDVVDQAKFEITERARTVVVNVDDSRLARWLPRLIASGQRVVSCGSRSEDAMIRVVPDGPRWSLIVHGDLVGQMASVEGLQTTNVACAIGAALELGLTSAQVLERSGQLRAVANRSQVVTAPSGVVVIDDTFNANPASADAALNLLISLELSGRLVVVTPGLIELGPEQYGANMSLAQQVIARGVELVIVGRTNVIPMAIGAGQGYRRFDTREDAVSWVRSSLAAGDGVLYLNDLPDHYP